MKSLTDCLLESLNSDAKISDVFAKKPSRSNLKILNTIWDDLGLSNKFYKWTFEGDSYYYMHLNPKGTKVDPRSAIIWSSTTPIVSVSDSINSNYKDDIVNKLNLTVRKQYSGYTVYDIK